MTYEDSAISTIDLLAPPQQVFAFLDDPTVVGAHMQKPSLMMLGASMEYEVDHGNGQVVGSIVKMRGRVLGMDVFVEEIVTERQPPWRKSWQTLGRPKLLVIDNYHMDFVIKPIREGSRVIVKIQYSYSRSPIGSWLGSFPAKAYAGLCVSKMTSEALKHFASPRNGQ
ncbi:MULTISPECIES: SRPBCC family protein [unclassified Rhizobium]|uniref:SRPBCC family protein n=1 Tax=unclassified Rhizobium TaxID=2613769 RepID=UPI00161AD39D|nr:MULTISPECIES: SRPBCC family protein [unclassified Rhizobium]MBB3545140.1 carbon monoxide dehydrogenase subunit G [Rhizobium sp. BK399]MCS4095994.1 carbon monoxide dehydrogenase subunit G [Rhizobium sp. BK176]